MFKWSNAVKATGEFAMFAVLGTLPILLVACASGKRPIRHGEGKQVTNQNPGGVSLVAVGNDPGSVSVTIDNSNLGGTSARVTTYHGSTADTPTSSGSANAGPPPTIGPVSPPVSLDSGTTKATIDILDANGNVIVTKSILEQDLHSDDDLSQFPWYRP